MAEMLAEGLADRGYQATAVASSEEAIVRLREDPFDALVTDLRMPQVDGLALLAEARRASPGLPVIVMTAYGAIDSAIESMRRGASHYLTKPFKTEELALFLDRVIDERRVRREASAMRAVLRDRPPESGIIAASRAMHHVFDVVERMAQSDVPVLLLGETGTGKGLFARILHARSDRRRLDAGSAPQGLPRGRVENRFLGQGDELQRPLPGASGAARCARGQRTAHRSRYLGALSHRP